MFFRWGTVVEVKVDTATERELKFPCGHTAKAMVKVRGVGGQLSVLGLMNQWAGDEAAKAASVDAAEETVFRSALVACPRCGSRDASARWRLWWRALIPTFVCSIVSLGVITMYFIANVRTPEEEDAAMIPLVGSSAAALVLWWIIFYAFGLVRARRSVTFLSP